MPPPGASDLICHAHLVSWVHASLVLDRSGSMGGQKIGLAREVARLCAARARADALELSRAGTFKEARAMLEKTARRIDAYAGEDAELKAAADGLRAEAADFGRGMDQRVMTQRYFNAYSISKNRMPDGKARR